MPESASKGARIHYVDWLRALIVYGIGLYHISLVFATTKWLVSNREQSMAFSLVSGFTFTWGIPAMFLIAGAGSWFSARSRSGRSFVRARFLRLVIPLIVGIALLSPLQRFLVSHNPPPSIAQLPGYYLSFAENLKLDQLPKVGLSYAYHLWFLAYLFAVSVACVPVLAWMRSERGRSTIDRMAQVFHRRGGMLAFALPFCVGEALLRRQIGQYVGWADVITYTSAYILGAAIVSDRRFEIGIRRNIWIALGAGVACSITLGLMILAGVTSSLQPVFGLVWGLNTWCWLVALLYLGIRWLDRPSRVITYASDSALSFYVLHHPVVLGVASFVVASNLGIGLKFIITVVAVFGITVTIYELGIRRWRVTRAFVGLRRLPSKRTHSRIRARLAHLH